jgi:hypothetical protein
VAAKAGALTVAGYGPRYRPYPNGLIRREATIRANRRTPTHDRLVHELPGVLNDGRQIEEGAVQVRVALEDGGEQPSASPATSTTRLIPEKS